MTRVLDTANVAEGLTVTRMAADAAQRVALWGNAAGVGPCLFILDASADTIDGPLVPRFLGSKTLAAPLMVTDLAVSTSNAWLATPQGLWTLAAGGPGATGAAGTLLTPALMSPESYSDRGWLRAELDIDLPRGAVIEASFGTHEGTTAVAAQLRTIAEDASASVEHRQATDLEPARASPRSNLYGGRPDRRPGFPLPCRCSTLASAGCGYACADVSRRERPVRCCASCACSIRTHRSIATCRRLSKARRTIRTACCGGSSACSKSTTQPIDEPIASIGAQLQADTAPDAWLDYIARWFDFPGTMGWAKRPSVRFFATQATSSSIAAPVVGSNCFSNRRCSATADPRA